LLNGTALAFNSYERSNDIFRRLTSRTRKALCATSAVCLFFAGSPAGADTVTLPDMLIGVTQGFLEFTVEDYLATSQTEGRYEIQVNQLAACACQCATRN
jgi:flagella basal body P-ring formation protein FlgA